MNAWKYIIWKHNRNLSNNEGNHFHTTCSPKSKTCGVWAQVILLEIIDRVIFSSLKSFILEEWDIKEVQVH